MTKKFCFEEQIEGITEIKYFWTEKNYLKALRVYGYLSLEVSANLLITIIIVLETRALLTTITEVN